MTGKVRAGTGWWNVEILLSAAPTKVVVDNRHRNAHALLMNATPTADTANRTAIARQILEAAKLRCVSPAERQLVSRLSAGLDFGRSGQLPGAVDAACVAVLESVELMAICERPEPKPATVVRTCPGSKGQTHTQRRSGSGWSCTCDGFRYRASCKHVRIIEDEEWLASLPLSERGAA